MKDTPSVKELNTDKIRTFMQRIPSASKSEIARATGLSFPTVTRLVDTLCAAGELQEEGLSHTTGGRSASLYARNAGFALSLLIRIEGREIEWIIKDLDAAACAQGRTTAQEGLLDTLDRLILSCQREHPRLRAVVIGISAMVAGGAVEQANSFSYHDLLGINIPLHFQNLTDIPVQIENDMNLAVMGQWYRSKTRVRTSVCMYFGTQGAGAGVLLDGEVWRGKSNFAGELSFLPLYDRLVFTPDDLPADDPLGYYVRLIEIYTVVWNPDQIILYTNPLLAGNMDRLRARCAEHLPRHALPHLELADTYPADYENGLYARAQQLIKP